jgi:hypothetical protein
MRSRSIGILFVVGIAIGGGVRAQPADCTPDQAPSATMPLTLDLGGRPGVPRAVRGQVSADVPVAPFGTLCGADNPPLPRDVLHGDQAPGEVLRGNSDGGDVLTGRGRGAVYIDVH